MRKKVTLPWIPTYYTIALYQQGMDYIAHELQSDLWVRDMVMLTALKRLKDRLIGIQLQEEKADKEGVKIIRNEPREPSVQLIERIQKTGVILRNVVLEPE